ncbi:MAG: hypothetical protein ACPG4T_14765, partial [Nannocystaceae bacterium]
ELRNLFCPYPCSGGGNSPLVGAVDITTWPQVVEDAVTNPSTGDKMIINAARVHHSGDIRPAVSWDVRNDGELQLTYKLKGAFITVGGEGVVNAEFDIHIFPEMEDSYLATLKVLSVDCETAPVCQYLIVTDHEPVDVELYPTWVVGSKSYYSTCPQSDNGGRLTEESIYHSVFASHTSVDVLQSEPVSLASDRDSMLCVNGAASKGMWQHNVFFDYLFDPHPRALDSNDENNALVNAYRAFYNGESYTDMGQEIWLNDGRLLDWSEAPPEAKFEGLYGKSGQVCKSLSKDHRYRHWTTIPNYEELPFCGPGVDGHIAVLSIPAPQP